MKVAELKETVKALYEELYWEYDLIGIRFEEKIREVGEICNNSKNNIDRKDEREFPEYGTAEFDEMEEMDGVSTYNLVSTQNFDEKLNGWLWANLDAEAETNYLASHAYIVVGDKVGWEQQNGLIDDGELLIQDGKVAAILF